MIQALKCSMPLVEELAAGTRGARESKKVRSPARKAMGIRGRRLVV